MRLDEAANLNLLWAQWIVEELLRAGVCGFCVSPGSRSAPLAVAVAQRPGTPYRVHFDERGAGFYALGWAKGSGRPVALVCTSGTAVANYWPAVVEAEASRTPLIVISADRPPELLDCGANQAIDQARLFGEHVRWACSLPCPDPSVPPEVVLTTAGQAVYRALRAPAGPVHLNCMFREPLAPLEAGPRYTPEHVARIGDWLGSGHPYTRWALPETQVDETGVCALAARLQGVERGVVVAGELRGGAQISSVKAFSEFLGWPVFADAASGLRLQGSSRCVVHYYDQMLLSSRFAARFQPEFVLHLGGAVTSKRLWAHFDRIRPEYALVNDHPMRQDPGHIVRRRFECAPGVFCDQLSKAMPQGGVNLWPMNFQTLSQRVGDVIDAWMAGEGSLNEIAVARLVSRRGDTARGLFVGNSMPIRDMDMFGEASASGGGVSVNRGASGIDGTLAAAAGYAVGSGAPVTAILGDVALLHDLNSLALLRAPGPPVIVVVINNDGGGIFSFLPIAGHRAVFEHCFAAPHGLCFGDAAAMFGIPYASPTTCGAFDKAYDEALGRARSSIIEVRTARGRNHDLHQQVQGRIAEQVDALLGR